MKNHRCLWLCHVGPELATLFSVDPSLVKEFSWTRWFLKFHLPPPPPPPFICSIVFKTSILSVWLMLDPLTSLSMASQFLTWLFVLSESKPRKNFASQGSSASLLPAQTTIHSNPCSTFLPFSCVQLWVLSAKGQSENWAAACQPVPCTSSAFLCRTFCSSWAPPWVWLLSVPLI